jgi:hypothetical protein
MNLNPVEQAKHRVLSINWKYDNPCKEGSHRLLFNEFLRREALAAQATGALNTQSYLELVDKYPAFIDMPGVGWLMHDYAAFFDPSLKLEDEEIHALAEELQVKGYPFWYSARVCVYFIHWAAVQDHPTVMQQHLLNPYEPLIMLYERGGTFRRDKDGTWEFASTAYFIGSASSYLVSTPVADLKDEDSLNLADKAFKD